MFTDAGDLCAFVPLTPDSPPEEVVFENLLGPANHFLANCDAHDIWSLFPADFSIVCTGHSLGASVACVVGLLLRFSSKKHVIRKRGTRRLEFLCVWGGWELVG